MNARTLGGTVLVFVGAAACVQMPVDGVEPRVATEFGASDVDPLERIAGWCVVLDAHSLGAWEASPDSVGVVEGWITMPEAPLALREPLADFEARVIGRRNGQHACAPAYLRAVAEGVWFRDALDNEDRRVEFVDGKAAIGPFVLERSVDARRPWRLALRSTEEFESIQQLALREWERAIGTRVAAFTATNTVEWREVAGARISVEGAELVLDGSAGGRLVTTRAWGDYRFECELSLPDGGTCDLLLRSDEPASVARSGFGLYGLGWNSSGAKPAATWHKLRVEQVGPWSRAWLDGECVVDRHVSAAASGWFGFELPQRVPARLRMRSVVLHDLGTQTWRELALTSLPHEVGDVRFAVACTELLPNPTLRIDVPGNMRDFVIMIRAEDSDYLPWIQPDPALGPRDEWTAFSGSLASGLGVVPTVASLRHVVVIGAHGGRDFLFVDGYEKKDMRHYLNQSGCDPDGRVYLLGADRAALADVRVFVLSAAAR